MCRSSDYKFKYLTNISEHVFGFMLRFRIVIVCLIILFFLAATSLGIGSDQSSLGKDPKELQMGMQSDLASTLEKIAIFDNFNKTGLNVTIEKMAECVNYTVTTYEEKNGDILREYKTAEGKLAKTKFTSGSKGLFLTVTYNLDGTIAKVEAFEGTYIIVTPEPIMKFTEFYIMGPEGKAEDYPTSVQAGNRSRVIVGVVNHESMPVNYTLRISLNNTLIGVASIDVASTKGTSRKNSSSNHSTIDNESPEYNSQVSHTITNLNMTLQNKETWERSVNYVLNNTGDRQKLKFLLYKDGNFIEPYRDLHLWVNVTKTASYFPENATNLTAARGSPAD